MSNTKIVNEIKRYITGSRSGADLARQPAALELAAHDGIMWATNRYWLTPAARVAPLLGQYNLNAGTPGRFEVNSTVRKHDDNAPDLSRQLSTPEKYPEPIAPVKLGGRDALVLTENGKFTLAVYQAASGALLGLPADDLAWLADTASYGQGSMGAALMLGPSDRFGEVRVMSEGHGGAPVLLTADVIRTVKPSGYETSEDGQRHFRPAETENLGPRTIGMLMAAKLDG